MPDEVAARVLARLAEIQVGGAGSRDPGTARASWVEPTSLDTGSSTTDRAAYDLDDDSSLDMVLPFDTVETFDGHRSGADGRRPRRGLLIAGAAAGVGIVLFGASAVYRGATNDATMSASPQQRDSASSHGGIGQTINGQLVHFQMSGRAYTEAALTIQAQDIVESPSAEVALPVADAARIGPIATPEGLTSCIATLGEADADQVAIDMATYAGQQAAVVVVVSSGAKQVFAVAPACSQGDPQILVGPLPMT
jgi:hypothetical protein